MVDRIDKLDPNLYRVQETPRDRGKRGGQDHEEEEEKKHREKDEFDKGKPFWKKLIPEASSKPSTLVASPLEARKESLLSSGANFTQATEDAGAEIITHSVTEEMSLSFSQRVLVMWGVLDLKGRPRFPMILSYGIVLSVIILSGIVIMRILWR